MRLTDDYDKNNETHTGLPVVYMAVGGITFFLVLVCIILTMNYQKKPDRQPVQYTDNVSDNSAEEMSEEEKLWSELGQSSLKSDDLDFWDMYKKETDKEDDKQDGEETDKEHLTKGERYAENAKELLEKEAEQAAEEDLSEGGTKTMVTYPDGTEQWVMINSNIPRNTYDYTGLVLQDPIMRYYENGAKISYMGVDISDKQGTVDFEALKKSGVDFVMIEIASRGYATGQVTYDDQYYNNMQKATEAGLDIGVIFNSQAATEAEAEEEAQIMLDNIGDFNITYPIVFNMELVNNDTSRIQNFTKTQLTSITMSFCKKIAASGYTPMIKGNKFWLLRKIDLTLLSNYDIWLSMCEDIPDYPYQFAMWQYKTDGKINGIDGDANLDICFIDYSKR